MKKAVLFLGILISFLLVTSCTTDDLDVEYNISTQALSNEDFNYFKDGEDEDGEDGDENENSETNNSTDPIIIIIKKD